MRVCSISDGIDLIVYSPYEAQLSCGVRQKSATVPMQGACKVRGGRGTLLGGSWAIFLFFSQIDNI